MKKLIFLLLAISALLTLNAQKKVEIFPSSIQAVVGSQVNIPVIITGFNTDTTSLVAVEFYLDFDNSVLTFDSVTNISPLMPGEEWFFSNPDPSLNRFSCNWAEPTFVNNVSVPDGTALFEIVFTYNGGQSALEFDEAISIFVHIDPDFNFITLSVEFFDGLVVPAPNTNTTVWNGVGEWNVLQNWSLGIPTLESVAIIETGTVNIINAVGAARRLEIAAGSTLNIMPLYSLTVADTLQNNGTLGIFSDENGTGSLIVKDAVEGTGNYSIEQYLTAGSHLAGAPLAGAGDEVFAAGQVKTWQPGTASFLPLNTGSILDSGKGYLVEMATNNTVSFAGSNLHQGDVTLSLVNEGPGNPESDGFNLICNPYPSAIEWLSGDWTLQNTGNAVYVWDKDRYKVWNGYLGDITDGIIPPMQGMFVKSTGNNPQITIPNNSRLHSNLPYYKNTEQLENTLTVEFGKFTGGVAGEVDDNVFYHFRNEASNGFDPAYDAYKMQGTVGQTAAWSLLNEGNFEKMAIDVRQFSGNGFPSVSMGFHPEATDTYYLRLKNVDSFSTDIPIVLQDLGLGVAFPEDEIDMRNDVVDFTYVFNATTEDDEYRFNLHFSPVGIEDPGLSTSLNMYLVNNLLTIRSENTELDKCNVEIFDVMGRKLLQQTIILSGENSINVERIEGLFIVRVNSEDGIITMKFYR